MISEICPNWANLRAGTQHPALENRSDREQARETEGRGKHLQTQGGCHEKVELCESNELRGCTRAALTSNSLLPTCLNSSFPLRLSLPRCKSMSSSMDWNFENYFWLQMMTQWRLRVAQGPCLEQCGQWKMALCERCERRRRGIYKGLSKRLIYEHPDQWVN